MKGVEKHGKSTISGGGGLARVNRLKGKIHLH